MLPSRSVPPVAVLNLVILVLAGCLGGEEKVPSLEDVFGAENVQRDANGTFLQGAVLEGALEAGASANFTSEHNVTLTAPKFTFPKQDPGPTGGGGETHDLPLPPVNATFEVRFKVHGKLQGYQARWGVVHVYNTSNEATNWTEDQPATQSFAFSVTQPGAYFVRAELSHGSTVAYTAVQFKAVFNVHFDVESSVHPFKVSGGPPPQNYEQMADRFKIRLPFEAAALDAATQYRGTWQPGKGSDVDLELDNPRGAPVKCSGTGGGGGGGPPVPSAAESSEEASVPGRPEGIWTVRVGSLKIAPGCASDTYYNNPTMVDYALAIDVLFG